MKTAPSHNKIMAIIIVLILIILPLTSRADLISDLEHQIKNKQDQIKEMEAKVAQLRNTIQKNQGQQGTLKKQIDAYEEQINGLEYEIKLTYEKISETNLQIQRLANNIKTKENDLETHKTYLTKTIRTINEYDEETLFEIVLKNDNFSDFLDQIQYIEDLQKEVQNRIQTIKEIKANLDQQKQQQESYKTSLESLNQDLKGKTLVLDFQKSNKEDFLSTTKNQEKQYQAQLKDLQQKRQEIEKEIYELEAKLRSAIDPSSLPTAQKGLLVWPIKNTITQGYGPTSITGFINNVYNFHNGIDIRANIGDPITAAADGIVTGVGNDGKYAYGKWITINHQNGLTTLYGHFSVQRVSVGQTVKRGGVIGYAGNTGFTTGPHLHFTVYSSKSFSIVQRWYGALPLGGSINPLNYLD